MSSLDNIRNERIKKLEALRERGIDPYPPKSTRTVTLQELEKNWGKESRKKSVIVTGRIFAMRGQGKILFFDLKDENGSIQVIARANNAHHFQRDTENLDIGDFIQVSGKATLSKSGEKSIDALKITMISKSIRPMPAERFAIKDDETRLRQRYLDLLMHPELREMFRKKAAFWASIRSFLISEGFLEVETPVLENKTGGAEARPFITHHNAQDMDMFLRISLELPLKRLIVGGFEKVFEIGRVFRNEGIDADHLQDYTQLEFYWAYADYNDLMTFAQKMFKQVIKETTGSLTTSYQGNKINWGKKWQLIDYCKEFKKAAKLDPTTASIEQLKSKAKSLKLDFDKSYGKGRLIDLIFKKTVRSKLIQPGFLVNPPIEIEPLAKKYRENPAQVERFQIVAGGSELGKGFSELNDPLDQKERFEQQQKLRKAGDDEAQMMDEDFVTALEHGMPPAAGFGLSERLFAVLMDKPIRETVFFPTLRPKK
ncbi:MAG: lysine--tRNA ligase [bacterium]|nr:lysine--tRNA ligase [bacterium]